MDVRERRKERSHWRKWKVKKLGDKPGTIVETEIQDDVYLNIHLLTATVNGMGAYFQALWDNPKVP